MKDKLPIALAVAIALIPLAFFAGKGCSPIQVATLPPANDSGTAHSASFTFHSAFTGDSAKRTASGYRVVVIPSADHGAVLSEPPIDSFEICGGALLPSGDSIAACYSEPGSLFRFKQFRAARRIEIPGPHIPGTNGMPVISAPPLNTLFYVTAETSTRDLLMAGIGIETTASSISVDSLSMIRSVERLRVSGEAMILPKYPFGFLRMKVVYFF